MTTILIASYDFVQEPNETPSLQSTPSAAFIIQEVLNTSLGFLSNEWPGKFKRIPMLRALTTIQEVGSDTYRIHTSVRGVFCAIQQVSVVSSGTI